MQRQQFRYPSGTPAYQNFHQLNPVRTLYTNPNLNIVKHPNDVFSQPIPYCQTAVNHIQSQQTIPSPTIFKQQTLGISVPAKEAKNQNQTQWVEQTIQRPKYQKLYNNSGESNRNLAPQVDPTMKDGCCMPCCWVLLGLFGLLALLFGILCGMGIFCGEMKIQAHSTKTPSSDISLSNVSNTLAVPVVSKSPEQKLSVDSTNINPIKKQSSAPTINPSSSAPTINPAQPTGGYITYPTISNDKVFNQMEPIAVSPTSFSEPSNIADFQVGSDQSGSFYSSIDQMWEVELNNKESKFKISDKIGSVNNWYRRGNDYYEKADSTYDGVLGGFANLSPLEINSSKRFLQQIIQERKHFSPNSVLDCGSGIGRISKQLLCQQFKTVDVVDQNCKYVQKSKQILKDKNIRHFYCSGLQDFKFQQKYDCVWIQWVFPYLSDKDAIQFLKRAKQNLNEGGIIFFKQNQAEDEFIVYKEDASVSRTSELLEKLFNQAGLHIIKSQMQSDWPDDLLEVKMYALQ